MDPASSHFVPPLLASLPTGQVTIGYAGANVHWQPEERILPVRSATQGHLSIYGSHDGNLDRVVIGVSFEEDELPSLNRQIYYHYLEAQDTFTVGDNQIEFVFNNFPATLPEDEEYKKTITWRIRFAPDTLDTVRSLLRKINHSGRWRHLTTISSLPAEERAVLYYNLRSALIEQPIPERLGTLGHWQNRLPGGTPSHMAYMEDRYRAKNIELQKLAQQDVAQQKKRQEEIALANHVADAVRVVPGQPDWGEEHRNLASQLDSPMSDSKMKDAISKPGVSMFSMTEKNEDENMMEVDDDKKPPPAKEHGMLSPPSSEEGSPKGNAAKQDGIMANGSKATAMMNGGFSKVALGTPYAASVNIDQWDGATQSPSLGSPALAIRRKDAFQSERKVSMNAVALLGGGKRAAVQLLMPEDTAREVLSWNPSG
jgi:hypothetical protein